MNGSLMNILAEKQEVGVKSALAMYSPVLYDEKIRTSGFPPKTESERRMTHTSLFGASSPLPVRGTRQPLPMRNRVRTSGGSMIRPGAGRVISTTGQKMIEDTNSDYWSTFSKFVIVGLGLSVGFMVISILRTGLEKVL